MKNADETRNYLLEEIKQSELTSTKHKQVWTTINKINRTLSYLSFYTSACVSISAFAALIGILFFSIIATKIYYTHKHWQFNEYNENKND